MMTVDDNDRVCAVARMTASKESRGEGAEPEQRSNAEIPQST